MSNKKVDKHSDVSVLDREKNKVEKPKKYKAVMYNDNYTPMNFVVIILMEVFHKPFEQAWQLMTDVHEKGKGIAGVYSKEICETKCARACQIAKDAGYPFLVTAEQE